MDDFSCYIWVKFLQEKIQGFECFKTYKLMVKLQLGTNIEIVEKNYFLDNSNNCFRILEISVS
jgi:hypothetical protein